MKCNNCNTPIEHHNYYTSTKCKDCYNSYQREYREKNRKKINEYSKYYGQEKRWLSGCDNEPTYIFK